MASVVEVLEISEGVEGSASLSDGENFTRTYQVEFDDINKFPGAAAVADDGSISIPAYGTLHPDSTYAYVINKAARPTEGGGGIFWTVTVTYGRPTASGSPAASPEPPAGGGGGSPPAAIDYQKINWGYWTKTHPVWKDTAGDTIRNSALDMYENQPTREDELLELTVTRTQSTLSIPWICYFNNTYNDANFTIAGQTFAPHTLKVNISANYPTGANSNSWEVKIVIKYDPDTWDWEILNAGYNFKDPAVVGPGAGALRQIYIKGQKPVRPVLLDSDGLILAPGGTPTYETFLKYEETNFSYLGLGL